MENMRKKRAVSKLRGNCCSGASEAISTLGAVAGITLITCLELVSGNLGLLAILGATVPSIAEKVLERLKR